MAFWEKTLERLGIRGKAATVAHGRVSMPITNGVAGGGVLRGLGGSSVQWWGDGVDGYDTLSGDFDYEAAIGEYQNNSVVAACLAFIISAFSKCSLQVGVMEGSEFIPDSKPHPLTELVANPHKDYDANWLWALLLVDYWQRGNHYWNIPRERKDSGLPVEIQPLAATITAPIRLGSDPYRLLDHYRYQPRGVVQDIPAERVIHFKYSVPDVADMRLGASPLYPVRREVYTDNKAGDVAAAVLRKPQPSGILAPESPDVVVDDPDLIQVERKISESSAGQRAGSIVPIAAAIKFTPLSFAPNQLDLSGARRTPEERICAIFNLPPVVVGVRAGLEHSTYNNGETAHKAAWNNCIAPLQDFIAQVLTRFLLPMYPGSEGKVVAWDRSQVGVLQPDVNAARKEAREDLKAGIITIEEARAEGGRTPTPKIGTLASAQTPEPVVDTAKSLRLKSGSVYDVADRFRAALMDNETDALVRLNQAYNRISRDLQREIDRLIADMESDPERVRTDALVRANALAQQAQDMMRDLGERANAIIQDGQRSAIETSLENSERLTLSMLGTPPPGVSLEFNRLPTEALEVLVGMASDGSPLEVLLTSAGDEFATELRETLVSSLAQGLNPKEAARRMAGVSGKNRARMETIARTEMLRVSREATRRNYEANSDIVNGYIRLSAADVRTCAACWALHGTKSVTAERFPQHPNCRCTMLPDVKSYAEILGDPSIPDTRPVIADGESLFAAMSDEEKRQILGDGLYGLYQRGARLSAFVTRTQDPQWGPTVTVSSVAAATSRVGVY